MDEIEQEIREVVQQMLTSFKGVEMTSKYSGWQKSRIVHLAASNLHTIATEIPAKMAGNDG